MLHEENAMVVRDYKPLFKAQIKGGKKRELSRASTKATCKGDNLLCCL